MIQLSRETSKVQGWDRTLALETWRCLHRRGPGCVTSDNAIVGDWYNVGNWRPPGITEPRPAGSLCVKEEKRGRNTSKSLRFS